VEKELKSYIVGVENGDIQREIYSEDSVRIIRKESSDYLKSTTDMDNGSWIRLFTGPCRILSRSLNSTELSITLYLASYIDYTTGLLRHDNGKFLRRATIIRETGYSEKTIDKILKNLKDKQIIGKHKIGRETQYTINPFIFMKGKRINKTLYTMYKNTKWANM